METHLRLHAQARLGAVADPGTQNIASVPETYSAKSDPSSTGGGAQSQLRNVLAEKGISYDTWTDAVDAALAEALQSAAAFSNPPLDDSDSSIGHIENATTLVPAAFLYKLNNAALGYLLAEDQPLGDCDPGLSYVLAHGTPEDIKDHLQMAASRIVLEVINEWVKESGEALEQHIKSENEKQVTLKLQESRKKEADDMRKLALKAAREASDSAKEQGHPDPVYIDSLISVLAASRLEVEGQLALGHIGASESAREIDYAIRTLESIKFEALSGSASSGD